MPTELELAWAAGLFEGEGSVMISKPTRRNWGSLVASVSNTDRQVIDFFAERWPGRVKDATGQRPEQRKAWVWTIASRRAAAFLIDIRPYIVRDRVKERITHALSFQAQKKPTLRWFSDEEREWYRGEQWNAYWWMGLLNERGKPKLCPSADQHRRDHE